MAFGGGIGLWNSLVYVWAYSLGVVGVLVGVVGKYRQVANYLWYVLGVLLVGVVSLLIVDWIPNFYLALACNSVFLTAIIVAIAKLYDHAPMAQSDEPISVRRILAGERVTKSKKTFTSDYRRHLYVYLQ